jgi:hypothetical protein
MLGGWLAGLRWAEGLERRRALALLVPAALVFALGAAVPSAQALGSGDERQLEALRAAGVLVEQPEGCGQGRQLATYNMGSNQLCLSRELQRQPLVRSKVITHESVHVIQDCLDGLATPTSGTLAQGLRASGQFSPDQLQAFFLGHLRRQGNLQHVIATTAELPLDSRQREIEAYALQADPPLVARLLASSCRPR